MCLASCHYRQRKEIWTLDTAQNPTSYALCFFTTSFSFLPRLLGHSPPNLRLHYRMRLAFACMGALIDCHAVCLLKIMALANFKQLWTFTFLLRISFHISRVLFLFCKLSTIAWCMKLPTLHEMTYLWVNFNNAIKPNLSGNAIVLILGWLLISISARKWSFKKLRKHWIYFQTWQKEGTSLAFLGRVKTQVHSRSLWSSWGFESSKTPRSPLALTLWVDCPLES